MLEQKRFRAGLTGIAVALVISAGAFAAEGKAGAPPGAVLRPQAKSTPDRSIRMPVTFTPDGRRLALLDKDDDLLVLDASAGAPTIEVDRFGSGVISPDGEKMLALSLSGLHGLRKDKYQMWNLRRGYELAAFALTRKQTEEFLYATFSPDGSMLATAHKDLSIVVWETSAGAARFSISGRKRGPVPALFSPNGRFLAVAGSEGKLRVWGMSTGEVHFEVDRFRKGMFSPRGKALLVLKTDGRMALIDVATGREVFEPKIDRYRVNSLEFSPDGNALATMSDDGKLRMWDRATGMLLFETKTGIDGKLHIDLERRSGTGWWTPRDTELVWDLPAPARRENEPRVPNED